jgi:tRNA threonylcarbamoyladenosine biosynthesis protein TsaB
MNPLSRASDEPLILSLETATRAGSLALTRGSHVLSARAGVDAQVSHSTNLLKNVSAVLIEAGVGLGDIDLFAVASGPGSFTGLRIGLATAKALAATLSRPSAGVPTLYGVALAAGPSSRTLAMIPAGRGEVFGQLLSVEPGAMVRPLNEPAHLSLQRLLDSLKQMDGLRLAGEAVRLYAEEIEAYARQAGRSLAPDSERDFRAVEAVENSWTLASPVENLAVYVAALGRRSFQDGETVSPEALRAISVRLSDAELNEQCRAQNQPAG